MDQGKIIASLVQEARKRRAEQKESAEGNSDENSDAEDVSNEISENLTNISSEDSEGVHPCTDTSILAVGPTAIAHVPSSIIQRLVRTVGIICFFNFNFTLTFPYRPRNWCSEPAQVLRVGRQRHGKGRGRGYQYP